MPRRAPARRRRARSTALRSKRARNASLSSGRATFLSVRRPSVRSSRVPGLSLVERHRSGDQVGERRPHRRAPTPARCERGGEAVALTQRRGQFERRALGRVASAARPGRSRPCGGRCRRPRPAARSTARAPRPIPRRSARAGRRPKIGWAKPGASSHAVAASSADAGRGAAPPGRSSRCARRDRAPSRSRRAGALPGLECGRDRCAAIAARPNDSAAVPPLSSGRDRYAGTSEDVPQLEDVGSPTPRQIGSSCGRTSPKVKLTGRPIRWVATNRGACDDRRAKVPGTIGQFRVLARCTACHCGRCSPIFADAMTRSLRADHRGARPDQHRQDPSRGRADVRRIRAA